jgi:hypothetical protein
LGEACIEAICDLGGELFAKGLFALSFNLLVVIVLNYFFSVDFFKSVLGVGY